MISFAPASFKTLAHSFRVAPVVLTSSTKIIFFGGLLFTLKTPFKLFNLFSKSSFA
jgi:hypothetical protein